MRRKFGFLPKNRCKTPCVLLPALLLPTPFGSQVAKVLTDYGLHLGVDAAYLDQPVIGTRLLDLPPQVTDDLAGGNAVQIVVGQGDQLVDFQILGGRGKALDSIPVVNGTAVLSGQTLG